MGYNAFTDNEIGVDKPWAEPQTKKTKDNFDYLYSQSSLVVSLGTLLNGSFEVDADSDGIPDNWTRNLYPGGSSVFDIVNPMHGVQSYSFTHPGGSGNGGGYLDSDYIQISSSNLMKDIHSIGWLQRSTVGGMHNLVEILCYDKDKVFITGSKLTIYDQATGNPTVATYSIRSVPPFASGTVYIKIRITIGKSDDTTAGTGYFDNVVLNPVTRFRYDGAIADASTTSITYVDKGHCTINLPDLLNKSKINIYLTGHIYMENINGIAYQRFRVGTEYSDENSTNSPTYVKFGYTLSLNEVITQTIDIYQQLKTSDASWTAWGKKDIDYSPQIIVDIVPL